MNLLKRLKRTFPGSKVVRAPGWEVQRVTCDGGQALFGVIVTFERHGINWPELCCECGGESELVSASSKMMFWLAEPSARHLEPAYACRRHAAEPHSLFVVDYATNEASWGHAFSASQSFLKELSRKRTPPPPPWVAFPGRSADAKWDQGVESFFLNEIWYPYWAAVSGAERAAVFADHPPPLSWAARLQSRS